MLIVVNNISLPWGASVSINKTHLRALIPSIGEESSSTLNYLITKKPYVGRLLIQGEEVLSFNSTLFSHSQLETGQVVYAAGNGQLDSLSQQPTETTIKLKACQHVCSNEVTLSIKIELDNLQRMSFYYMICFLEQALKLMIFLH